MSPTTVRLKFIADVRVSNVDKKSEASGLPVRLCNYTDVYYNSKIRSDLKFMTATATPDQVERFRLRSGQTLITKDSESAQDIGVAAYVQTDEPDLVCGYHLAQIDPDPSKVKPEFLYWAIASSRSSEQFTLGASGVTRFGLRTDTITGLKLALPPLDEQQRIADFVGAETARIDALIAAKQQMIALAREWLSAQRQIAIWSGAGGMDLRHAIHPSRPVMYGIVLPGPDVDEQGAVPIIKGGDVAAAFGRPLKRTTASIEARYVRSRVSSGDLVMSIRGGIGDVAQVPEWANGANLTQDVARLSPADHVPARWLLHVVASPEFQRQTEVMRTGSTVTGLNIGDIKRMQVPRVGRHEMVATATLLDAEQSRIDSLTSTLTRQIALLKERRQALITAAVSGELGL